MTTYEIAASIAHAHFEADREAGATERRIPIGYETGACSIEEDLDELGVQRSGGLQRDDAFEESVERLVCEIYAERMAKE